ncbi:MAG: outer membrane protein assembly factor [Gracilimonas sp.]|uniref:BamA/TamA family outer membrane protein n=1 Tax=Gracilimonas sp. TaxID=1974203 RepID=UPI003750EECB|nr:outer membrane protein assembly factor [Gracilimonas sp.]
MKDSQHFRFLIPALLLIVMVTYFTSSLKAQSSSTEPNQAVTDSVELVLLPALAYNSDWGVVGGGILNRYSYKNEIKPFHSYFTVFALASTNGLFASSFFLDKPHAFGSDQRLSFEAYLSRFFQNQYYGIGSYNKIDLEPEGNPEYYLYESFTSEIELILRRPIAGLNSGSTLDAYGILNANYRTPLGKNTGTLIALDRPTGIDGAHTISFGSGLIWENRDSEFDPSTGSYAKIGFQMANEVIGSGYNYITVEGDLRGYVPFHFVRDITFANRLSFTHTYGSLPYWKLADLGGEETMRGYPENRFLDDNVVFLNTELRTWLWEFSKYDIKLGGTLFADIGRTFSNRAALDNVFNDLKYTLGFGGNSSLFNENFILRGDMGFSDEGYGIYFTAGYMF